MSPGFIASRTIYLNSGDPCASPEFFYICIKVLVQSYSLDMSWNPKYFIVYSHKSVENLKWECTTHYECMGNIPNMLQELIGVSTVGGEFKLIWNSHHERNIINKYNISYQELEDYLKSQCCMISFTAKRTRKKAVEHLKRLGAKELCLTDSYRDMMLAQVYYYNYGYFPDKYILI